MGTTLVSADLSIYHRITNLKERKPLFFVLALRDKNETVLGASNYKDVKYYQQHSMCSPSVYAAAFLPSRGGHT